MSYRTKRYVDSSKPLVQRSNLRFPLTYDFPFAKKAVTTNIETIRNLLKQERTQNLRYDRVWKYATTMYEEIENFLKNQSKISLPDEYHIAIIAYTFEKPLPGGTTLEIYVDFNEKSRELKNEACWLSFPYKSLYCLLAQAVAHVQSLPDNNKPPYYRGVSLHYSPDFPHQEEVLLDFAQFTSFSTSKERALSFIKDSGGTGTLLVLLHPPMAGVGVKNYSLFGYEEEVVVCPWSTFTVQGVKRDGNIHEIVLASEGPCFQDLTYTVEKAGSNGLLPSFSKMLGF